MNASIPYIYKKKKREAHIMKSHQDDSKLMQAKPVFLLILRIAIGWHFLYEGIVKLIDPKWTAAAYLAESKWIFSDIFHSMAQNTTVLTIVDFMNVWGLILIGLGLFFGLFTRVASLAGIVLLGLYYVANPPLVGISRGFAEGNYLFIDKNLIELLALCVLALFHTKEVYSLDTLLNALKSKFIRGKAAEQAGASALDRREILKNLVTVPAFGAFIYAYLKKRGWESYEEKNLRLLEHNPDATTSATMKTFHFASLKDLKGELPYGQIGPLKLSRLFLGGNLMGGWAHARDLIYVSKLVKSYHTDERVFATLHLAEQCGINTLLTNPQLSRVINAYWRKEQGKIQFISDCAYQGDVIEGIKYSIDGGAHACYVQGGIADQLITENKLDIIADALELIRKNGLQAGIGAHQLVTVQKCVEYGLKPDFWVKTLHQVNYWSAKPEEEHDNIWCTDPVATAAFMNALEEPWIAFKVLAAGAIDPEQGFKFAFQNGADFLCVGMYDFQLVEDTNIALAALAEITERSRPWRA
jgi:uncharacterized membrane protein YphA (DoxX/SURF4 family)